jgi:DNA-binding SARP family transcriptional activator/class 3 adenylate cyclase
VDFRILGPLEIVSSEAVALGGGQQRAVIALLVVHAPEQLARDLLIDELWGERPPATAAHAVEVYVSAFRKLLRCGGDGIAVRSSASRYSLDVDPELVDARRFERLLREGQQLVANDPSRAQELLGQALAMWRGAPLSDLIEFEFARREAARLGELHAQAIECLVESRLAGGEHSEVISMLTALVATDPLRENPRRLLMRALYRGGRHAEALAAYRDACKALDEVGLQPGPELRQLEASILRHDESLHESGGWPISSVDGHDPGQANRANRRPSVTVSPSTDRFPDRIGADEPFALEAENARRRKVVTALCCDVSGSRGSGGELDPEALLEVTDLYFRELGAIVERHGGTVTTAIGDTAVAVFGVPRVREDDALRAVHAAVELRARLAVIGDEARVVASLRAAINTGLALVGSADGIVLGEPIGVATRLAQAAEPGDILLGEETRVLVRDEVETESMGLLSLKAKSEPVAAYRLLGTDPRSHDTTRHRAVPLVGRQRELAVLHATWERAVQTRSCHLVTLLGAAGVGKSRLADELFSVLGDRVMVLRGRCLHYGEGITFWPIVEALAQIGAAARSVVERITSAAAARPEETFWEVRELLEATAAERPVILHIDDLQWAEPMLLDLLDHVAELSRDVPILLMCLARPELLDERPTWAGGKPNATTAMIDALEEDDCALLLEHLGGGVPAGRHSQIISASGGNPLFLQELVALAQERGTLSVPATIHALLSARLERLDTRERELLERAAVAGEVFHLDALCQLANRGDLGELRTGLAELIRQDLIHPYRSMLGNDEAFRFRHLLIRDAAYETLPKALRARLHERFADWLDDSAQELSELDEIAGWHLEQAVHYRQELGSDTSPTLACRAAKHLHEAGQRAMQRTDTVAARKLLGRAYALASDTEPLAAQVAVDMAEALMEGGDLKRVDSLLTLAEQNAQTAAHAGLVRLHWLTLVRLDQAIETIAAVLPETLRRLEAAGDERGLAKAHLLGFWASSQGGRCKPAAEHAAKAAEHARYAGDEGLRSRALALYVVALVHGPPTAETLAGVLDAIDAEKPGPYLAGLVQAGRAEVDRLQGHMERARERFQDAIAQFRALQIHTMVAGTQDFQAWAELWGGEPELALPGLLAIDEDLAAVGERGFRSTVQATLALVFDRLGNREHAFTAVELADELTAPHDVLNLVLISIARARTALLDGDSELAERLAHIGVEQALNTDLPFLQGIAHLELGRLLLAVGFEQKGRSAAMNALRLFQAREDQPRIAETRPPAPPVK